MFSSIYYEQVALLHPANRLASDEIEEFLSKHVPHGTVGIGAQNTTLGMKTHIEYPDICFQKYNNHCHIEMGTYVLIDLL